MMAHEQSGQADGIEPVRGVDRRAALQGMALVVAAGLVPPGVARAAAPSRQLIATLGEIVIPSTRIPGAGIPAVYEFVALAVAKGLHDAPSDLFARITAELDAHSQGPFLRAPAAMQRRVVADLDHEVFDLKPTEPSTWPMTKALILVGYYTSEIGGSHELRYELAPGRYDADIPITPGYQALSNDWSGLSLARGAMRT